MTMKLKLDDAGHVVVSDGKPVYVHDDGKEVPFDATGTVATISRLNGEAKAHRERAEAAETSLKSFAGITDPAKALAALNTVSNLDDKKLVDAGEVQKVRDEIEKVYKTQLAEKDTRIGKLEGDLYGEKIGGSFARSKYITEKVAIPGDLVQSKFGNNYKVEDGKTVAYGVDGQKIYSRSRPGELADFEESIEILIDQYPHKDSILKGTGASGPGVQPGSGARAGEDLSKLPPIERMNAARAQRK